MWGALLTRLPFLARAFGLAKEHPVITALGSLGVGSMFLHGKDKDDQTQEQPQQTTQEQAQQTTQQLQQQKQQTTQTQSSSKHKTKSKGSVGGGEPPALPPLEDVLKQLGGMPAPSGGMPMPTNEAGIMPSTGEAGGLSQIVKNIQDLFIDLDKHRQLYDALSQQYLQAADIYEKQLLQTLQVIPFLTAKTPLNNITSEDLNEHLTNLFTSLPYTDAVERVNQLTKGYYLAKINGVDPKSLSTTDLMMIAENPVLARSVNENIVQFLEQMGEILKYKIKSNMDKVGAIKDQYQNILKELEEKGKLYKSIIDAFKAEMNLEFNKEKFYSNLAFKEKAHADAMALGKARLAETADYHNKMVGLRQQEVNLKEKALEQKGATSKGNKKDPIEEAEQRIKS